MAQWHELLHVPAVVVPPLAFVNAFNNSSLTAAFCPWATDGVRAVVAVSKSFQIRPLRLVDLQ